MIENSPFHNSKNITTLSQKITSDVNSTNEKHSSKDNSEMSFWDWFRGLVNPLQNLPIISGIYSSMNSEDDKSDRDLVQNSLGGFMYGGPIGAIAGFGNWVFNKIFDKTPTELAFDLTGLSKLWKDDSEKTKKLIANDGNSNKNIKNLNDYTRSNSGEWWKSNQTLASNSKLKGAKINKFSQDSVLKVKDQKVLNDKKVSMISNKYDLKTQYTDVKNVNLQREKPIIKKINNLEADNKLKNIFPLTSDKLEKKIEKKIEKEYREINFNYPVWKPNEIELGSTISDQTNNKLLKQKYLNIKEEKLGTNFNLKL